PNSASPLPALVPTESIRQVGSVADFVTILQGSQLLSSAQMNEVAGGFLVRFSSPRALAGELLNRGWLTPYQINQLFLGKAGSITFGPYLILERLGEGGAGQVFKARHQKMNRVVALKVVRKELLADADVVSRFYREIQIVSQLDHPNVVHAHDAGTA